MKSGLRLKTQVHFAVLVALVSAPSALAAPPPPPPEDIDLSILDMGASEEERMVYGEDAAIPQTGNENPEDLLRSSPMTVPSAKKGQKTAELPKALPMNSKQAAEPSALEEPVFEETMSDADPTVDSLPDEVPTDIASPSSETLDEVLIPAESESQMEEPPIYSGAPESSGASVARHDRTIPVYERENPNWGVDIHGSLNALGERSPGSSDDDTVYSTRNFGIGFEYQPEFLQSVGVFSFGPSVNLYILEPMGSLTEGAFSIMAFGGSAKYQFRYFRAQPFVPFVGFEYQMIKYSFVVDGFPSGWTTSTGLTFGGMLLLNWMEPSSAHSLWSETGIKRSYLVGEVKTMTAGEPVLSVTGSAIYFGLRLEY